MPNANQWWVNDQTPDNPYGKSEDYDAFLDYLGALPRSLTPEIAAQPLRINVYDLNDHPDYKAAAIGALLMERVSTPTYQTAGGEKATEGIELLVGFSEGASIGEISRLLKQVSATVVDGPRAGLYR